MWKKWLNGLLRVENGTGGNLSEPKQLQEKLCNLFTSNSQYRENK